MNPTPDSTLTDPQRIIAELQRQLAEASSERDEAIEQRTAITEVLGVINSSPGDLIPVFDAILDKAHTLCGATRGSLFVFDGSLFRAVAAHGYPPELAARLRQGVGISPVFGAPLITGDRLGHYPDITQIDDPIARDVARNGGVRTVLLIPLRRDGVLLGVISCNRDVVRPFTDQQIALLENFAAQAVIAMENARLITETREALEQQTATAEVLGVINSSPGDLAPVFDAILGKAARLCEAQFGTLYLTDGDMVRFGAGVGMPPKFAEFQWRRGVFRPRADTRLEHVMLTKAVSHTADLATVAVPDVAAHLGGARSTVYVPMLKDEQIIGVIVIYRQEVRPFTDKQIALVQNFAAQAVIAMENARLVTETREALDQQTATAEVLGVINSSPGDLIPVFDAMLEKAMRLCEAAFGILLTYDGERFHHAALRSIPEAYAKFMREHPPIYGPETSPGRLAAGEHLVHISDMTDTDAYRLSDQNRRAIADLAGARTLVAVPLRKDNQLLGAIVVFRQEVRPFTDKQIVLLQNFAEQAVIATENARLITETREALEQQTATAEVLGVINASPGDLTPVFDSILEKAHALCGVAQGSLQLYDGTTFRAVATHNLPEALTHQLKQGFVPSSSMPHWRVVEGAAFAQGDMVEIDDPFARKVAENGIRMLLCVALRKEEMLLGQIVAARHEARPFGEREIALLQNFAAQAVIAMENARLITETREALEQQTATAEVLGVINSSPGNLAPVFQTMLERGVQLCDARFGLLGLYDGDGFRGVAAVGFPPEAAEALSRLRHPPPGTTLYHVQTTHQVAQVTDISTEAAFTPVLAANPSLRHARTNLAVPMLKGGELIGAIIVFREVVRQFTVKEIALLENFAAQAVIAAENARLITETREALEQQTATAEVLGVINSSPGDLEPVFDAILDKAHALLGVACGSLEMYDGEKFRGVAIHGLSEHFAEVLRQGYLAVNSPATQPLLGGQPFVQIADAAQIDHHVFRHAADGEDIHTVLFVPLRRDDRLLGMIASARREVQIFSDNEIGLLQNFAAQAVIAMENARLLTETREALEHQTATAEVLGVINSSPGDLQPVFDSLLEKAMQLCGAAYGVLAVTDGAQTRTVAAHGLPKALAEWRRDHPVISQTNTLLARVLAGEPFIHTLDLKDDEFYRSGEPLRLANVDLGGARTSLYVPLLKNREVLGTIHIYRQEVQAFSDKQIALLQNFAAQAVIAMENARLLGELQVRTRDLEESLEYQTATSDVLNVISQSDADLTYVLQTTLDTAARLCAAGWGHIFLRRGERLQTMASIGFTDENRAEMDANPAAVDAHSVSGRTVLTGQLVQIADIAADPEYAHALTLAAGIRTMLGVPLLRDGDPIGAIGLGRTVVEPFTDKQMELVRTFADQAVIAIENARLLDEIRQRQAELRVTFDNMGDGVVMFDENLHLAAWNKNFQELLDLSDAFFAAPHDFDTYIGFLTARGEFGADADPEAELARLRPRFGDHYSFERARPDGRVIEVRHNPMPDGGFVLIYSDITERKRSEEEIRAARDAAEAAYRDLQAAQASLVQAQKMAALGQLTAGIAHEIKNPLNFVNNFASLSNELLEELRETAEPVLAQADADTRADLDETLSMLSGNLEKIVEHGQRADNIVKSMLEHSRGVSGERRDVDLNGLIEEALNLAYHGARAQDQSFNITIERDYAQNLRPIDLAPQEMTRVFLNLFGNGFYAANKRAHAADGDSSFRPVLAVKTHENGDAVEVRVRDNGTGIPPEIKGKLFQPFFTTKPTGEGTGLGLSISYDIITQQHGGTIEVASEEGIYTEFTIRLPRH